MELSTLLAAIDERPFRPFKIQLTSGEVFHVSHPDNIFILPSRHRVVVIHIFDTPPWGEALLGPTALAAILYDAAENPSSP